MCEYMDDPVVHDNHVKKIVANVLFFLIIFVMYLLYLFTIHIFTIPVILFNNHSNWTTYL